MKRLLHFTCCGLFVLFALELHLVARLEPGYRGTGLVLTYLAMGLVGFAVWNLESRHHVSGPRVILVAAVLARVLAFAVPNFTSTDMDRYLWDGRVALAGCDPYSVSADDPKVQALRASWPTPVEHAKYPTLYPPAALGLFAVAASFGPELGPWVWRFVVLLASLGLLWGTWRVLDRLHRREHLALVGLSPVLVIEGQVGVHLDLVVGALVALGLYALYRGAPYAVAVFWALGAALKLLPAAMLAVWLVHRGWRRGLGPGLVAVALFFVPLGAVLALGWVPIGSLTVFFAKWRFASPLWLGLEPAFGRTMPWVAMVGAGASGLIALGLARRSATLSLILFAGAVPLLWSPVVFPWYVVALVPVAVLARSGFVLAWMTVLPLTYEILDRYDVDGSWEPASWPVVAIAVAWGIGAYLDLRASAEPAPKLPVDDR